MTWPHAASAFHRAAPDEHGQAHRDDDDDGDLPSPGPRNADEEVSSEDTDGHADGDLDDATEALAVGDPEADDGDDGREERCGMREDVACNPPGDTCGQGALDEQEGPRAQPPDAAGDPHAAAAPGPVERVDDPSI